MKPGDRFGRLTVIGETDRGHSAHGSLFALRCDCGSDRLVLSYEAPLRRGKPSVMWLCDGCHSARHTELGTYQQRGPLAAMRYAPSEATS